MYTHSFPKWGNASKKRRRGCHASPALFSFTKETPNPCPPPKPKSKPIAPTPSTPRGHVPSQENPLPASTISATNSAATSRSCSPKTKEEFESLLFPMRLEHQPDTPTEHMLVDKMAEHFWLSRPCSKWLAEGDFPILMSRLELYPDLRPLKHNSYSLLFATNKGAV